MSGRTLLSVCVLALSLAGCAASPSPSAADCVPKPLAQLPVQFHDEVPTVGVTIDGQPVAMVLDLGADRTVIAEDTADRLHLDRDPSDLPTITGIGGSETRWAAVAQRLTLDGITLRHKRLEVASIEAADTRPPIDGLLGLDVLRQYDVDWDLPHGRVTLNAASGCSAPPVGWSPAAVAVPLLHPWGTSGGISGGISGRRSGLVRLPVRVDDRPLTAMLDSGTGISMIERGFAAGLEPPDAKDDEDVRLSGTGLGGAEGAAHRFRSLVVAGDSLPGWLMVAGPVPADAGEMILGADFLRIHRAWLPAGGPAIWFGPRVQAPAAADP